MKLRTLGIKFLIGATLLVPASAFAASTIVDCSGATPGAFTSIMAALASLPAVGPNSISVTGICHENVVFSGRTDLSISGNPTATVVPGNANGHLLVIVGSQRINIQNITFDGGRGVFVDDNSRVNFTNIVAQNSGSIGLTSIDSLVHIAHSTVKNNTRSGISVVGGTFYVDNSGTSVTGNGGAGMSVATAHLVLNGGDGVTPGTENLISNNTGVGVAIFNSAEADIKGDNRILGNKGAFGLQVLHTSTVLMSDGTISNNLGIGVHCAETSHCEWSGATKIDNNGSGGIELTDHSDAYINGGIDISGNVGIGVLIDLSSVFNSLGGNTINNNTDDGVVVNDLSVFKLAAIDTITGNGQLSLECDNGSLVVGDISTLTRVNCSKPHLAENIY